MSPTTSCPRRAPEQAREWVDLAGGVGAVLDRVRQLTDAGDLRLACHLLEYAVLAEPTSTEAHEVRATVYRARSAQQESSMARNILAHAALSSEQGMRDHAGQY